MVGCTVCGMKFDCSARAFRYYQAGTREPRCMLHRKERKHRRPETRMAELRREWANQFSPAELFVMAAAVERTLTGRRIEPPERLVLEVIAVEAEYLAIAASADHAR